MGDDEQALGRALLAVQPFPISVVTARVARVIARMAPLFSSVTYTTALALSTAHWRGLLKRAAVPTPSAQPSPTEPARVVTLSVARTMARMTLFDVLGEGRGACEASGWVNRPSL